MDDIVWTDDALQDLEDIAAYIALDNPKAAENTVRRIGEVVASWSLATRPTSLYIACAIALKSCLSTTARESGRNRFNQHLVFDRRAGGTAYCMMMATMGNLMGNSFWAAISGAVVGGLIAFAIQMVV